MKLKQTWRWYGPNDPVVFSDIKQAGATGIVTALHHIPHGEVWSETEINKRKNLIENAGFSWDVVESVSVHEDIKTRSGKYKSYLENYKQSLKNLASCGIKTVCYNFMPVLDWTRTQLDFGVADGSKALRFDWTDLALFDIFILKRNNAANDYAATVLNRAEERYKNASKEHLAKLSDSILMGIPGEANASTTQLLKSIEIYNEIGRQGLRENLAYFLNEIMPVCENEGIKMTIHPDDPPFEILGLPRIASTQEDLQWIFNKVPNEPNGLCFCAGSLGARSDNDLVAILENLCNRVHFVHLRNVTKEADGSFYEADHLGGDNNMVALMKVLVEIQQKRTQPIPYRPDHGHQMLDDLQKETLPGYSAIGRLRGLAEMRGLELGVRGY